RDKEAEAIWEAVYPELSEGKPGLMGAVISRAEAQVMRFASIYALLDKSVFIRVDHLKAALALWEYSERSAQAIFGELSGDPHLDRVKAELKAKGTLTITEVHGILGRNVPKSEVDRIITTLLREHIATIETVNDRNGRPAQIVSWVTKETN